MMAGGILLCSGCDLATFSLCSSLGTEGQVEQDIENTTKWSIEFGLIKKDYVAGIINCKFS